MKGSNQIKAALIGVLMLFAFTTTINAQALSGSITSQTNATCYGMCDGALTAAGSGGTGGPYTYSWSQGSNTQSITNLCAGSYTCTINDGVSTFTVSATVTEPAQLTPTASNTGPYCPGSTIQLSVSGVGGGTYSWAGPGGFTATTQNPSITNAITAMSGVYTVTVVVSGCTASASTTVAVNSGASVTLNTTDATCNGACDGSVTAVATGGVTPYTYSWSTGAITATITNLCAGSYSCTVTDAGGCVSTATAIVNQPAAVTATITAQTNVSCNGLCDGSATVSASGGVGAYTYLWSQGAVGPAINGLCAGTYSCTATDANNCVATQSVVILQPAALNASLSSQSDATCNGSCNGTASLNVSGGTPAYTFSWMPGGVTTSSINGLCAGSYTCTITDVNNCQITDTVTILEPSAISVSTGSNQTICPGNSANICGTGSGGVPPYSYIWSQGPPNNCTTVSPSSSTTYTLTVTDANGCIGYGLTTIYISSPVVPVLASYVEPSCTGTNGSITFSGTGGSGPYFYDLSSPPQQNSTGIFSGLATSTYTLTATDINGCSGAINFLLLDSCEVVWPGDADNDLVANNNDILDIGLYYGSTGITRLNANTSWAGQPAQNWANTKPNSYNEKHDDCNGDGIVDASDTTAVIQNYSLVHPPYKLMANAITGTPLTLQFVQDTVNNYGKANIKIMLGSATSPANNIYGLALTISIDTTIVAKDSTTLDVSNSWIAAGSTPFLNNVIENYNNGEIDVALCRTTHTHVSGFGEVGDVSITMKDDITGKVMAGFTKTLTVGLSKVKIITATGDTVSYSASGDSLVVDQLSTAVATQASAGSVKMYPNPAHDFALIHSSAKDLVKLEVYSLQGKKIEEVMNDNYASEMRINTKNFEKGIYIVKVFSANGVKLFRLQVI